MEKVAPSERFRSELDEVLAGNSSCSNARIAKAWKIGQVVGMRTDPVTGDATVRDQVELDVDHVILQTPPPQAVRSRLGATAAGHP